jgi:hypothetical protein
MPEWDKYCFKHIFENCPTVLQNADAQLGAIEQVIVFVFCLGMWLIALFGFCFILKQLISNMI